MHTNSLYDAADCSSAAPPAAPVSGSLPDPSAGVPLPPYLNLAVDPTDGVPVDIDGGLLGPASWSRADCPQPDAGDRGARIAPPAANPAAAGLPPLPAPGGPTTAPRGTQPAKRFETGLCECGTDTGSCLDGLCCPWCSNAAQYHYLTTGRHGMHFCMLFGSLAADVLCIGLYFGTCLATLCVRTQIRERYGMPAECCADLVCAVACTGCVICQDYREIAERDEGPGGVFAGRGTQPPLHRMH